MTSLAYATMYSSDFFQSFFSKKVIKSNLKRTKSVTKLDRRKPSVPNELEGYVFSSLTYLGISGLNRISKLQRRYSMNHDETTDRFNSAMPDLHRHA